MDNSKDLFESMVQENIHISYTGPFDSQVLSVLAKNIEFSLSLDPRVNKKMFKIFIELAQNIAYYSAERVDCPDGTSLGLGTITIQEFDDYFMFATGNLAQTEAIQNVINKCSTINNLDRDGLREYKRQQRNLPPSRKGGGNIGLIQVALTADNPLSYQTITVDETNCFYIVGVKISKQCLNSID